MDFYHSGMRRLQDRYEGRSVADRLAGNRMRTPSMTKIDGVSRARLSSSWRPPLPRASIVPSREDRPDSCE